MGKRYISSDKPKMSKSYAIIGDYRYMPYTTGKAIRKPRVTKKMLIQAQAQKRTVAVREKSTPIPTELQAWIDSPTTNTAG